MVPTCITGRVVPLPAGRRLQSGATHVLQNGSGHGVVLLRSRSPILREVEGTTVRLSGYQRGRVSGEPLPIFEVEGGVRLDQMPLRPGLDPFTGPAAVSAAGLPVRPLAEM